MNTPPDPSPSPHRLELALEASSSALICLQWILAALPEEDHQPLLRADQAGGLHRLTSQAIESLRQAITELRRARGDTASQLALGFVLAAGGDGPGGDGPSADPGRRHHPIPRRTA